MSIIIDSKMSIYAYNLRRGDTLALENNIVGQTIRSVRKAKGMSQEVLSGLCGHRAHASDDDRVRDKAAISRRYARLRKRLICAPGELVRKMEEAEEKRDK